jgi:hypothetical protein
MDFVLALYNGDWHAARVEDMVQAGGTYFIFHILVSHTFVLSHILSSCLTYFRLPHLEGHQGLWKYTIKKGRKSWEVSGNEIKSIPMIPLEEVEFGLLFVQYYK